METVHKEEVIKRTNTKQWWKQMILWLPILLVAGVVPLIVRVEEIQLSDQVADILEKDKVIDFFASGRSVALCILAITMVVIAFLMVEKRDIKNDLYIKIYLVGASLFLGVSLIATLCTEYKEVAWGGMPDRAEGFWITLCYIIIFTYTIYTLKNVNEYKYLVVALSIVIMINTVLGIFQYIGYDLLTNIKAIQKLIIPKELQDQYLGYLDNTLGSQKIYGTMFHYNYMGSFGAMMIPFFAVLTIGVHGIKEKVALGLVTVCSGVLLFGSTSRGGLVGLVCAIVMGLIVFGRRLVKKKTHFIGMVIAIIMMIIGGNQLTNGALFSRIPTLLQDIQQIVGTGEVEDPISKLPVQDIQMIDNEAVITMGDKKLILAERNGELYFKDEAGQEIEYEKKGVTYSSAEGSEEDTIYELLSTGYEHINFVEAKFIIYDENVELPLVVYMRIGSLVTFRFKVDETIGVSLCDGYTLEPISLEHAKSIGFKGKEKIGSARGYIWSRSLPLLKENLLWGSGPDTFIFEFPQRDYLAKWAAYDTPNMIVDKAHNIYLQYFINNGGLALLGFLIIVITYLVQSFKLYALRRHYERSQIVGVATFLGIVGYLGAGFFNDSIICVAPVFWILLGIGVAVNYLVSHGQNQVE